MEVLRQRVETSNGLLLVGETGSDWLRDIQHVRNIVPAVWIIGCGEVLVKHARPILLEEANKRVAAWSSIQPQREGIFSWVATGFEEPVKDVYLGRLNTDPQICIHTHIG